ncbi:hypothetical protein Gotri_001146 [Gossypium trilobum]|uniref:Uncharacterized protein n=1 Tax=Gossypium trilobum TaxID=34281 RepID=A0A7J9FFT4_9ROSI|nr:hypothetical protein [Gossypium trilobum]
MARHEFELKKAKLLRDINSLQEENYQLMIDVQIEKSRIEKRGKAKKEEKKVSRAMIELRKKSVEFETMSAELMTSQSKRQELKGNFGQ